MGQGNIVMLSFGTFLGKVFSKDRIPVADVLGCVVKGMSQVARATFFHVSIAVCEFSGLVCRWRAASVSKNLVRRTEIGEIPNFCKDYSSGVYSHAGNRENWWIELIYNLLNRIFNFINSYDLLNQYAMKSLTIAPDNPKAYCWLIRSLKAQGMNELATNELAAAKEHLTTEEYEEILAFGANW